MGALGSVFVVLPRRKMDMLDLIKPNMVEHKSKNNCLKSTRLIFKMLCNVYI